MGKGHTATTAQRRFTCATILLFLLLAPAWGWGQTTIFSDNFETGYSVNTGLNTSGANQWLVKVISGSSVDTWAIGNGAGALSDTKGLTIYRPGSGYAVYSNRTSTEQIAYRKIDASYFTGVSIGFSWKCLGESNYDYGTVVYSLDGTTWNDVSATEYCNSSTKQTESNLAISAVAGKQFYIGFRWKCDGSGGINPSFTVDDIVIKGNPTTPTLATIPSSIDFGFIASGTTSSSNYFDLMGTNLTGAPGNITVTAPAGFEVSDNSSTGFGSSVSISYSSSSLSWKRFYVRFKPTAKNTTYSDNITISGGGATQTMALNGSTVVTYCSSNGNPYYSFGITGMQFGTLSKTSSSASGYSDFTTESATLSQGNNYQITVNVNTRDVNSGNNYPISARAWIDWNQNGIFTDAGEQYDLGNASSIGATNLCPVSINVPSTAALGSTRMRISAQYDNYPASCDNDILGEVEDYTINVAPNIAAATYYSYQTGLWSMPTTWTSDPSGTTQVGSTIPGPSDNVVILTNRTVTLPSAVGTAGLNVTINDGGFLDLATYQLTAGLNSLSGQGTLRIGSAYFPSVGANSFVQAGGGTTEYYSLANFTLPTQDTYNNLSINAPSMVATQLGDVTLNGNLKVKAGTYRINNDAATRKLNLFINGDVAVDVAAAIAVGKGVTNGTIGGSGGTAPFLSYYENFHRVVVNGNFTNNGTVRFTNLDRPTYNAFPPTGGGSTSGAASVYFMGSNGATLTCNGITDFYNLLLDKNDQSTSLTVNSSNPKYFRLFGANNQPFESSSDDANPYIRKALWIRTGSLVLKGSTAIPSLTEGEADGSDYFIPAKGALVLDGPEVVVLTTADDYGEVNVAYGVNGGTGLANGVTKNSRNSLGILGKVQVNQGYLSTRESAGITYWSYSSGQLIVNGGTVDTKQIADASGGNLGLFAYMQDGGSVLLRGRFQHQLGTSSFADITSTAVNTARADFVDNSSGTFSMNANTASGFTMTGGTMKIYDACSNGDAPAFVVGCPSANINVTGGTLELLPTAGSVNPDATNMLVSTTAPIGNLTISRASGGTTVKLGTNVYLLKHLNIAKGVLNADSKDIYVGGDFSINTGTTYTTGNNRTVFNGAGVQTFKVDVGAALSLYRLKVDKRSASDGVVFAGTQKNITVADSLVISTGKLDDNGNAISAKGGIYNSGTHCGVGKIVVGGIAVQTIDGNGSGVFQNIELVNTNGAVAPVALTANATIKGLLTFSNDKLFDIGSNNLTFGSAAAVVGAGIKRYIQTSGQAGDGGVSITYSASNATGTFHVGAKGAASSSHEGISNYTPATIGFSSAPSSYGLVTVTPVGYEHPSTTTNGTSLSYFWKVKSEGFPKVLSGVTHSFTYSAADERGTVANYVPAMYDRPTYTWKVGTKNLITARTISDWSSPTNSSIFLDGDYTAGVGSPTSSFDIPRKYFSISSGRWDRLTTWSTEGHTSTINNGSYPTEKDIVIIGDKHTVTLKKDEYCASLQIEKGGVLDIYTYTGGSFGSVLSHSKGNGLFKLTTPVTGDVNVPGVFSFPKGDFSDFNVNRGTTEFYDIDGSSGALYILPAGVTSYGNLVLRAKDGDNLILPNNSRTTINGDLTCTGNKDLAWIAMSWNTSGSPYNSMAYNPTIEKTVHIKGNLYVNAGTLIFMDDRVPQHLLVDGNITVAPTANISVSGRLDSGAGGAPVANTLYVGGDLVNNNKVILRTNDGYYCDLTFGGSQNSVLKNELGTPSTILNKVTINKGNSQTTTFTCKIGGTLSTLDDDWLTLQNGSFRYERSGDLNITTRSPFTIPSTAELYINSPSEIYLAQYRRSDNTVYLNGKLTLAKTNTGSVNIGSTSNTGVHNDIEYSSGGASEIDVKGGSLVVNGQVRRNPSNAAGILGYTQEGGTVTIMGNKSSATNASLEILNDGSWFNMSGDGKLYIKKGSGTTFGDLYLRPSSSTVDGGEIILGNTNLETYKIDASVPLYNLTINGSRGNNTVNLMVNPLVLKGNLLLSNTRSILNANNIDVTIKGNLENNGNVACYSYGANTTTFSGGAQQILGSSTTNFNNLLVSPVTSLTIGKPFDVKGDLTISAGTLICGANTVSLYGNLENGDKYTASNEGVVLKGDKQQLISGLGHFGTLTLSNSDGAALTNSILLDNDLRMDKGVLDINRHLLSLAIGSRIVPINTSTFDATKMITSDGVFSNVGIRKFFDKGNTSFTFPLGSGGKYTPAVLTINGNTSVGSVRLNNINDRHPSVLDVNKNNVLKYYWEVESSTISGFGGGLSLEYNPVDVKGPEDQYIAAKIAVPGSKWTKAAPGSKTDNVDEVNNKIEFTFPAGSSSISGEYTAGIETAIPDNVETYTSIADGSWSDVNIWTPTAPNGGPNGAIVVINTEVTIDSHQAFSYRTAINETLKIDPLFFGHNLGTVTGSGTLFLENGLIPAGRFDAFFDCAGNATLEYGGSGTYTIIADLYSSIPNLTVSGTGTRVFPNKNLIVCKKLNISGPTLDNSIYNKMLTIKGSMLLTSGGFKSGTGPSATVSFNGKTPQVLSSSVNSFTAANSFNNLEISNPDGLTLKGPVEVGGNLYLTNGKINSSTTNSLTITNSSISCIIPDQGSVNSYVNGPLTKKLDQGYGEFVFPVGASELGYKVSISATQGGTALWTAQYFPDNKTYTSYSDPLQAVNSDEYWDISAPAGSNGFVKLGWNASSGLTPLMSAKGKEDMRVAEFSATKWNELPSIAAGDNYNGAVETAVRYPFAGSSHSFTTASVSSVLPKAKLSATGAVCGTDGIPVTFSDNGLKISPPYLLDYLFNTTPKSVTVNLSDLPNYKLPTPSAGTYKLVAFKYNGGANAGVVDSKTIVTSYEKPSIANAGIDQSICGATSATLAGNLPALGVGKWSIASGIGGTITDRTISNSTITGTNGSSYILKWTIDNGGCTSEDDVEINFTLKPTAPIIASPQTFCAGATLGDVVATVSAGTRLLWYDKNSGSLPSSTVLGNGVTYFAEAENGCRSDGKTAVVTSVTPNVGNPIIKIDLGAEPTCQLENATTTTDYSAVAANSTGLKWSISNTAAGTIDPITGLITWSKGFSGIVNVIVTADGCGLPTTAFRTVTVNSLPDVSLDASSIPSGHSKPIGCANGNTVFLVKSVTSGLSYTWDFNSLIAKFTPANGVGVKEVTATWLGNSLLFPVTAVDKTKLETSINVKVMNATTGCSSTLDIPITLYRLPVTGPPYHVGNSVAK